MAEVEFGGIKFRGGKIFVILTLLSTLAGALWGGFEFYKDYVDMREKIETYTAPDLSDYDKRIDLAKQKLDMLESEISLILDGILSSIYYNDFFTIASDSIIYIIININNG